MARKRWSKEDDDFLREVYREMTNTQIGKAMGRTPDAVQRRKQHLGFITFPARRAAALKIHAARRAGITAGPEVKTDKTWTIMVAGVSDAIEALSVVANAGKGVVLEYPGGRITHTPRTAA